MARAIGRFLMESRQWLRAASLAVGLVMIAGLSVQADTTAAAVLRQEAAALMPLVTTEPARQFLTAATDLPEMAARTVYINAVTKSIITPEEFGALTDSATRAAYTKRELDASFYYYTRYGTPLAFVRALDLAAGAGLQKLEGARVADFGFGSIGQLRLMASLGAEAVGIEVDPLLKVLYAQPGDTGPIAASKAAGAKTDGKITLNFGRFPAEPEIVAAVGKGYDAFISKNTLKRGYIHPSREADPRMLIDLGVDDSTFVATVYELLKPDGVFLIYNLHPKESAPEEKYIPWSDGRCPFDRALLERVGFTVLEYDRNDTEFAHTMAKAIGWDKEMELEKDLLGQYTLMRK